MNESYEVLRKVISNYGGAGKLAKSLGISQSLVYKWCQQKSSGAYTSGATNPLDRLLALCRLTNDRTLIEWLCQHTNSFCVENPQVDESIEISSDVVDNTQNILKEFSDVLEAVTESYANENRIDQEESVRIRKEWEELKSITEKFVCACEKGIFDSQQMK